MPEESELPETMRDFHSYNAAKIDSGSDFRFHMSRVVDAIGEATGHSPPSLMLRFWPAAAGAAALAAGLAAFLWWSPRPLVTPAKNTPAQETTGTITSIPASVTTRASANGGFLFPDSDRRLLGEADLKELSEAELRIARNEIFARHGRFFVDPSLVNYFSQFSWYRPNKIEPDLNSIESRNIETIQLAEHRK